MHYTKPQVLLKGIEIVIMMEQRMAGIKTEGCYQTINGFPHGVASLPESTVILCGRHRQVCAVSIEYLKIRKVTPNLVERSISPDSLEDFTKIEISETDALSTDFLIEPSGVNVCCACEVVNPYSCIHNDHKAPNRALGRAEIGSSSRPTVPCL